MFWSIKIIESLALVHVLQQKKCLCFFVSDSRGVKVDANRKLSRTQNAVTQYDFD